MPSTSHSSPQDLLASSKMTDKCDSVASLFEDQAVMKVIRKCAPIYDKSCKVFQDRRMIFYLEGNI